jgi:uncharacterized protein YukE
MTETTEMIKAIANDSKVRIDRIVANYEALEKENAELKKLKRECETSLCRAEYQYNYEQLTKAKKLLKRCHDSCVYLEPLRSEIEQFLKETER